jgi:hypothetical protein
MRLAAHAGGAAGGWVTSLNGLGLAGEDFQAGLRSFGLSGEDVVLDSAGGKRAGQSGGGSESQKGGEDTDELHCGCGCGGSGRK